MESMNLQQQWKPNAKDIDLSELLRVLKRGLWVIILITTVFTFLAGFYSYYTFQPLYQSSIRVLVKSTPNIMETLLVMMDEPVVLKKVVDDLKLNQSPEVLSKKISVGRVDGSQIITITVTESNPYLAAKIANGAAAAYESEIPKLLDFNDFQVMSKANEQQYSPPINDNSTRNTLLGFVLGLIISIGSVFVLHSLNDSVKSEKEIEFMLGVPVIGSISKIKRRRLFYRKKRLKKAEIRGDIFGA